MSHSPKSMPQPRAFAAMASLAILGLVGSVLPACAGEKSVAAKPAATAAAADKSTPVAEVNGKPVTMADLETLLAPQLAKLEQDRQKLLEQGLDRLVEQKLMETEAAARGIDVLALQQAEIQGKIGEVTDAEVATWYQENQARIQGRPLEQIAPQIKQFLIQQRGQAAQEAFIQSLRAKYKTRILMDVARVQVAEAGSPAKGGPVGSPITIIEFSDFQCPFCSRINPSIDQAKQVYGDKVRFVFRQFPLNIHPQAPKAGEASLCANEQGKFWEMHDALFADQQKLSVPDLKATAAKVGVDVAKFDACLDSGRMAEIVARDLADGQAAGVSGTPALFVNGRFINGAVPFEELARVINDELSRKGIEVPAAK
ncbi:MAG: thioredoxin domain-containing protein [Thermoanaerobaculia bacterium]|nr:thioredoxin domain-containing protein [Thermoanaerobaculia bacterium]